MHVREIPLVWSKPKYLTRFPDRWDFVTSLWFEYRLLTKKILFRWQFVSAFFVEITWEGGC